MDEYLKSIEDKIKVSFPMTKRESPSIESQNFKFVFITISESHGFLIATKRIYLTAEMTEEYISELKLASTIIHNLNKQLTR